VEHDQLLRLRWEIYLTSGNAQPLLDFLQERPEFTVSCAHTFPFVHRVADPVLGGRQYRVQRCSVCAERLTFVPVNCPGQDVAGESVPYWVQGKMLQQWVEQRLLRS
jgi:hypothetical protein